MFENAETNFDLFDAIATTTSDELVESAGAIRVIVDNGHATLRETYILRSIETELARRGIEL